MALRVLPPHDPSLRRLAVVVLFVATVICPRVSSAMEIQMFDDMARQDQRDYVKFVVKDLQKLLIELGQQGMAEKVGQLFRRPWTPGPQYARSAEILQLVRLACFRSQCLPVTVSR